MSNDVDPRPGLSNLHDEETPKRAGRLKKDKHPEEPSEKTSDAATATSSTNEVMPDNDRNIFTSIDNLKTKTNTVELVYQKKTQLEHILIRPDTYVGSVQYIDQESMWVYDNITETIVQRKIRYVPALYKIFDEILVNAADNKQRDPKMSMIKVNINKETNTISVYNNGKGIPVVMHKGENMFVPELIFGTLLTSSNYNDSEKKVTGGRNGYGAKLCNIFSKEFTLETSSKEYGKAFKQTWINSMTKDKEPQVIKCTVEDYTKVTFKPDLSKFNMTELDDDIVGLMMRRAFDVAGSTQGIRVYLNGKAVPVQGFKQYVEMYMKGTSSEDTDVIYEKVGDRWEVALTASDQNFKQVSFVNSIATTRGGTHVDYIADQICRSMISNIRKKTEKSTVTVRASEIKPHLWLFVNCLIENPSFDSQTKETLTSKSNAFGTRCELSELFFKKANKCGIVESVLAWVEYKQREDLRKLYTLEKGTKLTGIPKLEDANDAGTEEHSQECTLIVTEGDSAKTLAVSGLAVVGRDRYGVFPLRGKLLNVREGNMKQMAENQEINALVKILGLQYGKKYETAEDFKTLRYGKVMIMADQDQDGSHIKGLVINFIHHSWPSLIHNGFMEQFITPIIKAFRGSEELSFFSIPGFKEWQRNTPNSDKYTTKYYKGLGTSTSKEAKEYFSDMARHRIKFRYAGEEDDAAVMMAFSKKETDKRKQWLNKWMAEKTVRRAQGLEEEHLYNNDTRSVTYSEFINKELVLFSNTDNERSIPSLVDGLKPGQRKIIFTCFKRADKREVKVAQLAGAVGELSAYHHGEASLMGAIVNLAQDFVGSNNINLLLPLGQFGTRLQGGKDSASPRYIFTKLNPITRVLFPAADENVLRFLYEDNQRIEPEWYCPIIPTVLVNGALGIGTAWSTSIPNYNPRQVVENIRRLIQGRDQIPLEPWYKGFTGEIIRLDNHRFICNGEVSVLDNKTIEITELPVKVWTQAYKELVIEPAVDDKEKGFKGPIPLSSFKEYHTDTTVRFLCSLGYPLRTEDDKKNLHRTLKLQTVIGTNCMVLYDGAGCLRKFNTPEEICEEFFEIRKQKYIERKAFAEGMLKAQSDRLSNQARFIVAKIKGDVILEDKTKSSILEQMTKLKFDPDPVKKWEVQQKEKLGEEEVEQMEREESSEENELGEIIKKSKEETELDKKLAPYEYLLSLAMIKVSTEEKQKLLKASENKLIELKEIQKKSWADLWEDDLKKFLDMLDKSEEQEKKDRKADLLKKAGLKGHPSQGISSEIYPSKNGQRVVPFVDQAMKDKYEKMDASKLLKTPRVRKGPKTPKTVNGKNSSAKTPKSGKVKKDEWNSDQSESEEEEIEEDPFEDEEEEVTSCRESLVRARGQANGSRMAEEAKNGSLPCSSSASSSHGEVNDGNPQEKRGPRARTYEELVEEKRRRTEKLDREDSRGGRKRKREPSPEEEEEDSYDSDDSVVVIPPPNACPFIPNWKPREHSPKPEEPTRPFAQAIKDPLYQLPPEPEDAEEFIHQFHLARDPDYKKHAQEKLDNAIAQERERGVPTYKATPFPIYYDTPKPSLKRQSSTFDSPTASAQKRRTTLTPSGPKNKAGSGFSNKDIMSWIDGARKRCGMSSRIEQEEKAPVQREEPPKTPPPIKDEDFEAEWAKEPAYEPEVADLIFGREPKPVQRKAPSKMEAPTRGQKPTSSAAAKKPAVEAEVEGLTTPQKASKEKAPVEKKVAVKKQTPARGSKLGTSAGKSEAKPEAEETVANVEEVADNPESPKKHTASRGRKPKTSATVGPADPEVDEPPHSEETAERTVQMAETSVKRASTRQRKTKKSTVAEEVEEQVKENEPENSANDEQANEEDVVEREVPPKKQTPRGGRTTRRSAAAKEPQPQADEQENETNEEEKEKEERSERVGKQTSAMPRQARRSTAAKEPLPEENEQANETNDNKKDDEDAGKAVKPTPARRGQPRKSAVAQEPEAEVDQPEENEQANTTAEPEQNEPGISARRVSGRRAKPKRKFPSEEPENEEEEQKATPGRPKRQMAKRT